jgi:hypothetical protein
MMLCCPTCEQVPASNWVNVDLVLSITYAPRVYSRFYLGWSSRAANYMLIVPMSDLVLGDYLRPTWVHDIVQGALIVI